MLKKHFFLVLAPLLIMSLAIMAGMSGQESNNQITDGLDGQEMADQRQCGWNPGDPHKMHFPQLPDEDGWDINASEPKLVADDFLCTETGWIKDIHFWGSWKNDNVGEFLYFVLTLHEDIPVRTTSDTCYADGDFDGNGLALTGGDYTDLVQYVMAGTPEPFEMYRVDLNGDCQIDMADVDVFTDYNANGMSVFDQYGGYPVMTCCDSAIVEIEEVPMNPPTAEGWYSPYDDETIWSSQQQYYQYNFCFDSADWFWQDSGTIYWLSISADVVDWENTFWGWKSSEDHWNDNATWTLWGFMDWNRLWEPTSPLTNDFWLTLDTNGAFIDGGGVDAFGDGWFYYPMENWWNIWFYDHPFDSSRKKVGYIEFDATPLIPGVPQLVEVAVNWSTDLWSFDYPNDSMPPTPNYPEEMYVGRHVIFTDNVVNGHVGPIYYEIPVDYNPEWVSVDIRGYNFVITMGTISHECRGPVDMAFVITGDGGEELEACCLPDGSCNEYPPAECMALGGTPLGPGTVCGVERACCLPSGACDVMDTLCCLEIGGTPTVYTACGGDFNNNGIDDNCEPAWGACCQSNGMCELVYPDECADLGGEYHGNYVFCLGDANGNNTNDRCETWNPGDPSKMHYPQTPDPVGWDVNASSPQIQADDWMCTETGPITDIHVWGSWMANDIGQVSAFILRIYADVPADVDLPYSHPGEMLWEYIISDYNLTWMPPETQGWYDPWLQEYTPGDHQNYFQYDLFIPEQFQFFQEEGTIYWLGITVELADPEQTQWGWKSSINHWNDKATWNDGSRPLWTEMYEPPEFTNPLDLAFVITGPDQICDCIPGDCNGDGVVNVGDAVCMICYIFQGCPDPRPYSICSGDANCDCQANIGDAVYVISYVFRGGPAPCACEEWLENCGPPLRK
jgi:hypothetical protein